MLGIMKPERWPWGSAGRERTRCLGVPGRGNKMSRGWPWVGKGEGSGALNLEAMLWSLYP